MEATPVLRRGPIEGTSRVLRELIRTPRFKKTVGILIRELDPENAGLLVRTLMWEDPEFFLSLLGAAPDVVNAGVKGLGELVTQLANFPPGLLASFISVILDQLDVEGLGRSLGETARLLGTVRESGGEELLDSVSGLVRRFATGVSGSTPAASTSVVPADAFIAALMPALGSMAAALGREAAREGSETNMAVQKMAAGLKEIAAENPDFMRSVVAPLVEAGKAALSSADVPKEGS